MEYPWHIHPPTRHLHTTWTPQGRALDGAWWHVHLLGHIDHAHYPDEQDLNEVASYMAVAGVEATIRVCGNRAVRIVQ